MTETKTVRLSKLARELNVGISTMVEFLKKKGYALNPDPNSKVTPEEYDLLQKEFRTEKTIKKESEKLHLKTIPRGPVTVTINDIQQQESELTETEEAEKGIRIKDVTTGKVHPLETSVETLRKKIEEPKVIGKIDLEKVEKKKTTKKEQEPAAVSESEKEKETPAEKTTPIEHEEKNVPPKDKKKTETELVVEEAPTVIPKPEIKVVGKIDIEKIAKPAGKVAKEKETEVVPIESESNVDKELVVQETPVDEIEKETLIEAKVEAGAPEEDENFIRPKVEKLTGPTVVGKIDLAALEKEKKKPVASSSDVFERRKRKRKRIKVETPTVAEQKNKELQEIDEYLGKKTTRKGTVKPSPARPEIDEDDVQRQIKDTLARLTAKGKSKASRYRREKREELRLKEMADLEKQEAEAKILRVTEFVTVNELASLMNVPVVDVIQVCLNLGLIVSINQRLDAEHLALVADEFNYKVEFVVPSVEELVEEEKDDPSQLVPRPPIVTVMGHVDHGKTKLLDYIRKTNVIAGEAGGITQHIGAYSVTLENGRMITFLDTPGHEAFTAMRARGASITDVAIIVIAADDGVMPQTVEAINHAQAAGVPMVFAFNKIDKPTANPEKIKEELANMNLLVEDWGGKYQSQEISAKEGKNVDLLLEKVLLEAELLDLKANPNKRAKGTVIESTLDKGRGYVATVLVADGTLRPGDLLLAGYHYGHVKALFNERGKRIDQARPSMPAVILGLNGAPQAGEKFVVMTDEREVKDIATRREQLQREQGMRTQKHITLDEIGRRIAIGNFKELNIIVKGDVDGSVEALADSLIKLSTQQVQVNVIHKAVGQISESDILLAAASNAIIVGFQVRPSFSARKLAEKEQIDIRLYSIIYDAINEIKDAIAGMLSPEMKEEILGTAEVLETFKVSKVGTVAGCIVREGKIVRNSKVRVIRDGIVVYTGELASLKRYKEDIKEVTNGMECGLGIQNFNDVKVGDMIEAFSETEVKPVL